MTVPFAVASVRRSILPSLVKILYADHDYPDLDLEREIFANAGLELEVAQCTRDSQVIEAARGCAGILLQYAPITAAVMRLR